MELLLIQQMQMSLVIMLQVKGVIQLLVLDGSDIRAANGTATWATVSDRRVKKDIEDSTVGLNFINDLRPRTFKYKNKGDIPRRV
jgi:hypothetical protein